MAKSIIAGLQISIFDFYLFIFFLGSWFMWHWRLE